MCIYIYVYIYIYIYMDRSDACQVKSTKTSGCIIVMRPPEKKTSCPSLQRWRAQSRHDKRRKMFPKNMLRCSGAHFHWPIGLFSPKRTTSSQCQIATSQKKIRHQLLPEDQAHHWFASGSFHNSSPTSAELPLGTRGGRRRGPWRRWTQSPSAGPRSKSSA